MLKFEVLDVKKFADTAENEPFEVSRLITFFNVFSTNDNVKTVLTSLKR